MASPRYEGLSAASDSRMVARTAIKLMPVVGEFLQHKAGDARIQLDIVNTGHHNEPLFIGSEAPRVAIDAVVGHPWSGQIVGYRFAYDEARVVKCYLEDRQYPFSVHPRDPASRRDRLVRDGRGNIRRITEVRGLGPRSMDFYKPVAEHSAALSTVVSLARRAARLSADREMTPVSSFETGPSRLSTQDLMLAQHQVIPMIGKLVTVGADALLHVGERMTANTSMSIDCGLDQLYRSEEEQRFPRNRVAIWSRAESGNTTEFTFEARPFLRTDKAIVGAKLQTVQYETRPHRVVTNWLYQLGSRMYQVCKEEVDDETQILADDPVESVHDAVMGLAQSALAAACSYE